MPRGIFLVAVTDGHWQFQWQSRPRGSGLALSSSDQLAGCLCELHLLDTHLLLYQVVQVDRCLLPRRQDIMGSFKLHFLIAPRAVLATGVCKYRIEALYVQQGQLACNWLQGLTMARRQSNQQMSPCYWRHGLMAWNQGVSCERIAYEGRGKHCTNKAVQPHALDSAACDLLAKHVMPISWHNIEGKGQQNTLDACMSIDLGSLRSSATMAS